MIVDQRPVALIPAYKPTPAILAVVEGILDGEIFQAVVCVDDGSGPDYCGIFDELAAKGVEIIRHYVNLGKGTALKTGFNAIACKRPKSSGIVTLDADGQHLSGDVLAVARMLVEHPNDLVLGTRTFENNVPFRSRLGNQVTRRVMRLLTGIKASDTQTGLRGIPLSFIPALLKLSTGGYDFELDMLISAHRNNITLREIPITTIYIDGNKSSHFHPLLDSLAIYFVLLRHIANALLTAALDYLIFVVCLAFQFSIFSSMVAGRIGAGLFNFMVGKSFVFRSKDQVLREFGRYFVVVISLMLISYLAIVFLIYETSMSPLIAKIVVELTIFLASFAIQRVFVFQASSDVEVSETDWDVYYSDRSSSGSPTRKITELLILRDLRRQLRAPPQTITEFGGGDSCFYDAFRRKFPDARYRVVDKSSVGIHKFLKSSMSTKVEAIEADLLTDVRIPRSDVVYSVGLIEHFDREGTAKIIKSHFEGANAGGIVLMTYPTRKVLYSAIRAVAELLGIWRFPDERPLTYDEVAPEVEKQGIILSRRLNWYIGLSQEILVCRKTH